jgi:hypothetical protein
MSNEKMRNGRFVHFGLSCISALLAGEIEKNVRPTRITAALRWKKAISHSTASTVPQFMNDANPKERLLGLFFETPS